MEQKEVRPRHIALAASLDEISRLEAIKRFYRRTSDSDTLRFLINKEAEKILSQNVPVGVICQEVQND